jgi:predicted small metal-binding protein
MASFKCKDMGMQCEFEVKDENKDELMAMISMHAEKTHNMKDIPPDMAAQVQKVIKE